jgi:hypothetical protein
LNILKADKFPELEFFDRGSSVQRPTNMKTLFKHWGTILPPDTVKFTTKLNQTCGSGLTSYLTICRAMITFPDFQWPVISRLAPTEWNAFCSAGGAIVVNPYCGFSRKIGNASTSGYKTIASVAKELLIRLTSETALARLLWNFTSFDGRYCKKYCSSNMLIK